MDTKGSRDSLTQTKANTAISIYHSVRFFLRLKDNCAILLRAQFSCKWRNGLCTTVENVYSDRMLIIKLSNVSVFKYKLKFGMYREEESLAEERKSRGKKRCVAWISDGVEWRSSFCRATTRMEWQAWGVRMAISQRVPMSTRHDCSCLLRIKERRKGKRKCQKQKRYNREGSSKLPADFAKLKCPLLSFKILVALSH